MTNDELASKLSNEIESATGNFNTELSEQREQSMKFPVADSISLLSFDASSSLVIFAIM